MRPREDGANNFVGHEYFIPKTPEETNFMLIAVVIAIALTIILMIIKHLNR